MVLDISRLKLYTIGIVLEDKERDSNTIKFWPYELLPLLDGKMDLEEVFWVNDGIDSDGTPYEVEVSSTEFLEAEWFSNTTNRVTSPNLRAREKVLIYRYADSEELYWVESGREDYLRRGEHVIYAYSDVPADPANEGEALTPENCYVVEVNTFDGLIQVKTSKRNNEPFLYTLQIDAANGKVTLQDDADNYFHLSSADELWKLHNTSGTWLELREKNINAHAVENINYEAVKDINFTCANFNLEATERIYFDTPKVYFKTPDMEVTGNVKIGGTLEVADKVTMKSELLVESKSTFKAEMAASGIVSPIKPIVGPNGAI